MDAQNLTILVVDDVIDVLETETILLGELGFNVIPSNSPSEALAIIASDSSIDMVVTDLVMLGGMDGWQLAERIRELRPTIKVAFTSGCLQPSASVVMKARGELFLPKPWRVAAVANFVKLALNA